MIKMNLKHCKVKMNNTNYKLSKKNNPRKNLIKILVILKKFHKFSLKLATKLKDKDIPF